MIASTASPYKFLHAVMTAIDPKYANVGDFDLIGPLSEISGRPVPRAVSDIVAAPIRHDTVCEPEQMDQVVCSFLGL